METSLLFDWSLRQNLHPEVRRFAICLASLLDRRSSTVLVSEADIERWGIDVDAVVGNTSRPAYRQPWGVLSKNLIEARLITDEERRPRKKRLARLHVAPVATNRRQGYPIERPTIGLREAGIPTFEVPFEVFQGERLKSLPTTEFFVLMATYALTDMAAYGGVDPAHLRVEDGSVVVSTQLSDALTADVEAILGALLRLESLGYVTFVPMNWRVVEVPSSNPTYEREHGGVAVSESSGFVIRPTVSCAKKEPIQPAEAAAGGSSPELNLVLLREEAAPYLLAFEIHGMLPQVPQYEAYGVRPAPVVADRLMQSMKSQLRKAVDTSPQMVRGILDIEVSSDRPAGLVHVAKAVADALRNAGVVTDDRSTIIPDMRLTRGKPDRESRPYVGIRLADLGGEVHFERRVYVEPCEWRPPARRIPLDTTGLWESYEEYVAALKTATTSFFVDIPDLTEQVLQEAEMSVTISSGGRYDVDNVALFVTDLVTCVLEEQGVRVPVDRLVSRVVISCESFQVDEPRLRVQLRRI